MRGGADREAAIASPGALSPQLRAAQIDPLLYLAGKARSKSGNGVCQSGELLIWGRQRRAPAPTPGHQFELVRDVGERRNQPAPEDQVGAEQQRDESEHAVKEVQQEMIVIASKVERSHRNGGERDVIIAGHMGPRGHVLSRSAPGVGVQDVRASTASLHPLLGGWISRLSAPRLGAAVPLPSSRIQMRARRR